MPWLAITSTPPVQGLTHKGYVAATSTSTPPKQGATGDNTGKPTTRK